MKHILALIVAVLAAYLAADVLIHRGRRAVAEAYTPPARAGDLPDIEVSLNQAQPTATNPLGVKGAGEAGATGAPPAIVNAVCDALSEHGVDHIDMPLTPEAVWRALQQAQMQ